jgi:hypothetical protein
VGIEPNGRVLVDYAGNPFGPVAARVTASLKPAAVRRALEKDCEVLLVFGGQNPNQPILFDVVRARLSRSANVEPPTPSTTTDASPPVIHTGVGCRLGRIVALKDDAVLVDYEGNPSGPLPARTTAALRNLKDPILLQFLTTGEPIIVGQVFTGVPVEESGAAEADLVLKGRRVHIEAQGELVLVAGRTKIHLDAKGKAVTTADQIVSRAQGANKVQGGSVQLN